MKQIINLAAMELKASPVNLILCWILLPLFGTMILFEIGIRLTEEDIGIQHDIIMIFLFSSAPFLFRARYLKYNKVSGALWASPTLIMQSQLPIPKNILFQSRFVIFLAYHIPATIITFFISYMIIDVSNTFSFSTYLFFAIIWLSIGISLGIIYPASDVGDHITVKTMIFSSLLIIVVTGLVLLFFYQVIGYSILSFTILLAENHRLIAFGLCVVFIICSWLFWLRYMKQKIQKLDYL